MNAISWACARVWRFGSLTRARDTVGWLTWARRASSPCEIRSCSRYNRTTFGLAVPFTTIHFMREDPFIPPIFCWTRFGVEAGETIEAILERKEHERQRTSGVYFWGIGNSVASGVAELVRRAPSPQVLFSPIKSRPRAVDVHPRAVVRWRGGVTLSGERITLPRTARVMSGQSKAAHYALVCACERPLQLGDYGRLNFGELRNLVSGNPLGASQVTAVVERLSDRDDGRQYVVALRARLVAPYFLRLVDPVVQEVDPSAQSAQAA
jgi:hypothetical protein